jgi:hypothetical protein
MARIADPEVINELLDRVLLYVTSSALRAGALDPFITPPLGATKNTSDMLPRTRMAPSSSHTSDLGSAKSHATRRVDTDSAKKQRAKKKRPWRAR